MGRKKKVGRPKMAKNAKKQGFPLRLRPDLIKELKKAAKEEGMLVGPYVEKTLEYFHGSDQNTEEIESLF